MLCPYTGGPDWSPRTIRRPDAATEAKAERKEYVEDYRTVHLVFEALKPYPAAYDAVIRALEREVEKERRET